MPAVRRKSESSTLGQIACQQIEYLGDALGLDRADVSRVRGVFETLAHPWSELEAGIEAPWANDIGDDATPFEFSVAFDGADSELRMLVEPQREPYSLLSNWRAGLAVLRRLAKDGAAHLGPFSEIAELFEPDAASLGPFSQWHAAVARPGGDVFFKVYLNPQIRGSGRAFVLVSEALHRLELPSAQAFLGERLTGEQSDELRYLSVDLLPSPAARTKIYVARRSASEVERLVGGTSNFSPGEATDWLGQLCGSEGPFSERPILTCFSFRPQEAVPEATLHVPIRCYAMSDAVALKRVAPLLSVADKERLRRAVARLTPTGDCSGTGGISYVSLRPGDRHLRLTSYLAPRLYQRRNPWTQRNL